MTTVTDADLIALALGHAAPAERERLEAWVAAEPLRRARYGAIRDHLARYETLTLDEGAPPLPFRATLPSPAARPAAARRPLVAAAGVLLLAVVLVWANRPFAPAVPFRAGPGLLVLDGDGVAVPVTGPLAAGTRVTTRMVTDIGLGPRGRVMLDEGGVLELTSRTDVSLREGRAFFDLGPGAFTVHTPLGDVEVLGTAFEVDVGATDLAVAVERGRVRAAGHLLEAGEQLRAGVVERGPTVLGAFFRRPVLRVAAPPQVRAGHPAALTLELANPTGLALVVVPPDDVVASVWLTIRGPQGEVRDLALDGVAESWRGADADDRLEAGETRRAPVTLPNAFPEPGRYRCRAMYRPRGEAPVVSAEFLLEVAE